MLEWFSALLAILGSFILASKREPQMGFVLFFWSSVGWCIVAFRTDQYALLAMQLVFSVINIYGIYKWADNTHLYEEVKKIEYEKKYPKDTESKS